MSLRLAMPVRKNEEPVFRKTVYLRAELQEMSAEKILSLIPESVQRQIKAKDSSPVYRAYAIAQEGLSEGTLVGIGNVVKRWVQSAIQKVFEKLKSGLKIFHNHGPDNKHEGRTPIGQLVAKHLQYLKDKLTAIAIVYIKPEFRTLPLDVASIETDISISHDEKITGPDVGDVTGIALGNSFVNQPGFPGAELLGELQAFADRNESIRRKLQMAVEKITLDELKTLVKEEKVKPSDIFTSEQLAEDSFVKGFADSKVQERIGQEFQHRRKTEEKLTVKETEWADEKKKLEEKITDLTKKASSSQVQTLFEQAKEKRELSEQQTKFIEKRLKTFTPENLDTIEKDLDKHLDSELDEFKEYAKTFGIEDETEKKPDVKGEKKGTKEETKIKADAKKSSDVVNPFLPRMDD